MLIEAKGKEAYSKLTQPWKRRRYKRSIDDIMHVTPEIAGIMPSLSVPIMPSQAQDLFREILNYELPRGNSAQDHLTFAWARGFCVHPCDWVPSSEAGHGFPELYQTWATWLAEEGYTPFYSGVLLTAENFDDWTPRARRRAFNHLQSENRQAAHDLLLNVVTKKPAAIRVDLLKALSANALFSGNFPSDIPVLHSFLNDSSSKVRAVAQAKLDKVGHLVTLADHAQVVAKWFKLTKESKSSGFSDVLDNIAPASKLNKQTGPKYVISPEAIQQEFKRSFCSTDLDNVAIILGLTPYEMVEDLDLDMFAGAVFRLFMSVQDNEAKKLLARRLAKAGKECPSRLFQPLDKKTWSMGLQATLATDKFQPWTLFEFLGRKAGTFDIEMVRKVKSYPHIKTCITSELEDAKKAINVQYDPLRILALVANKDAAAELLDEARSAGAAEDNPRLAPLKFNLQL